MIRYEELLVKAPSSLCVVVGDVTSTMACAITAKKLHIPVAHVEAGIRSGDMTMPEEVNRLVTDSITDWFFTTSDVANANLRRSGVSEDRIFYVGNTMIDTLLSNIGRLEKPGFFDDLGLAPKGYFVTTLHRPANVDRGDRFSMMLAAIGQGTRDLPVLFPVHPRTVKTLRTMGQVPANVHLIEPQPYLQFNWLVKNAFAVITDSGGITEETTVLGIPCLTLRDSTERPETVEVGTNMLIGADPDALIPALNILFDGKWKSGGIPPLWDGQTAPRIVAALEQLLAGR
jgi:UDP-N-acetylglucosamine 2-epimerase (non-hydrolysing)